MGTYAATSHTTYVAGYDMTGDLNATTLQLPYESVDKTTFRTGVTTPGRVRQSTVQDVQSTVNGWFSPGEGLVDEEAWAQLGGAAQPVTQTPAAIEGERAYFYQAGVFEYTPFASAQVGGLIPFTLNLQGAKGNGTNSVGAVAGKLLKAKGDVSATGATGTAVELGAVADGQYLYAALHLFAVGTTITAVLESDADDTFASATTRATFGPLTTTGGTWATRVAGPVTDTWYRLRITAVTGTHTIACAAGIK